MTDKQIIIDNVDVSGCEWIREVGLDSEYICTCNSPNKTSGYCKHNLNCYYKQLKRKEQECEEFRKANDEKNELLAKLGCPTIATARRKVFCLQKQLDQLKAENERLQKLIAQDQCFQNKSHKCVKSFYIDERYKQAIEKVKELIQKEIDDCFDCGDCISCGYNCCLRQAMQICNEVISE